MTVDWDRYVTASEIARLVDTQPSAITNWRKRDLGFPEPVVSRRGLTLFYRPDVLEWLETRGYQLSPESLRARANELLRHADSIEGGNNG